MNQDRSSKQFWMQEIKAARKREESFRKRGKEITDIYETGQISRDGKTQVPFNILFSNTETLLPALFSAVPRPIVERRFKDDDPLAKYASLASKRMLETLMDTNREGYESFGETAESSVLDSLVPGRGGAIVKYDATFGNLGIPKEGETAEQTNEAIDDKDAPKPDSDSASNTGDYTTSELICTESLVWDRVYYGFAKKWHKVPWIAYEFSLTKPEVADLLQDQALADTLEYTQEQGSHDDRDDKPTREEHQGQRLVAEIYQIWDKAGGRVVRYVAPSTKENTILRTDDDPLGLTGFYNQPKPLQFVRKASNLVPTAPYDLYRTQAQELNRLTQRITKIVEAVKVRGAYDQTLGDLIKKIFDEDDTALIPAEIGASLAVDKGFQNAIWLIPVEALVTALTSLYQARESCKQVIYEITGISDIIRGSSNAQETATAQSIKNQWSTLRLKRMQRDVARYCRDLMRMMLEMAATKFSEETWASMTNLPYLTTSQQQQLQQRAQVLSMTQVPGHPPSPDAQAVQAELQKPTWGPILQMLRDDLTRSYRIDIETNSMVEPEAAEDHKAMTELLGAVGQTLSALAPLVQSGSLPFQAAQALLLFIARRFRFGLEIEDQLLSMQAPKPPEPDKSKEAALQQKQAELEMRVKQKEAELAVKEQTMQATMQLQEKELNLKIQELELALERQQFQMEQQAQQQTMEHTRTLTNLENTRFKTENVVNKKADTALGQGAASLKGLIEQLAAIVQRQAHSQEQLMQAVTALLTSQLTPDNPERTAE